jgi:hypothetical protein
MCKLEKWAFVSDIYAAPELGRFMFQGRVYDHPRFEDGHPVTTSYISGFKDGVFTTASGSEYILGEVDPEYEKEFPNAFERIVKKAQEQFN